NSWSGADQPYSEKRQELIELIQSYNTANVPTIFYSKEDPINFEQFKSLSNYCNYIFTSSVEKVKDYIEYTNNENVNVLQHGVNPTLHNPIGNRNEKFKKFRNKALYAGNWDAGNHKKNRETEKIFDEIIKTGIPFKIMDFNFNNKKSIQQFPSKYIEYLVPPVNKEDLINLNKMIPWSVNINQVKYS